MIFNPSRVPESPRLSMQFSTRICRYVPDRRCTPSLPTYMLAICERAPTNISGITGEFRPRDNRHLIVHECSAFGPGELQAIRDLITIRNHKSRPVSERLHAIW